MDQIRLRYSASLANVGPGYDIFALALNEPYDEVNLSLHSGNNIELSFTGEPNNIPVNPDENCIGVAIRELFKRKKLQYSINVEVNKMMRTGAGLGTSGGSAVAALYGINKLLKLSLSDNEMIDIACISEVASGGSPHADNAAAALLGGFILIRNYHPIDVVKIDIPEFHCVVAVINKSLRTTRGFITYEIGQEKLKEQMARCSRIIHALHTNDIFEFGRALSVDHIAEPVRGAAIPQYIETKNQVLDAGAYGCTICGGGSSVIAFCEEENQDEIADIFESGFGQNPLFVKTIKTTTSNSGIKET